MVNPNDVRGAGDIVSPKTLSDFGGYNVKITESSEDVLGRTMTVYTGSYCLSGALTSNSSGIIGSAGDYTFEVVLKDANASAVSGATVNCHYDMESLSDTTDSNGVVSFTVPISEDMNGTPLRFTFTGDANVGACFCNVYIHFASADTVVLSGDKSIIQSGETVDFTATVTGDDIGGNTIPIGGILVSFYEVTEDE